MEIKKIKGVSKGGDWGSLDFLPSLFKYKSNEENIAKLVKIINQIKNSSLLFFLIIEIIPVV